ncbi:hypothetical protein AiwAL_17115 [Acidiphilium sp. AL]|uniref:DUF4239 domain-containing protein n=1 Tax=Acidiphilium iwatense TaxID=768198 RepID=A0ABS9E2P7_9PROT|nr:MULTISPECIES: hypothetical protein [Acidiphilium]MCF3947922.1 hypothetical protein [Acidiphilium iwatense]MCU4161799.1 hypothetical protein [Acidiphilium sp. AL]
MRIVIDHPPLLALIMAVLLGFATWLGQRLAADDAGSETPLGPVQGAVLGLAGLMLGFSFSMALSRYEQRRSLVVDEANAIGTTYLRAGLLAPDLRDAARPLLRRYVTARLAYFGAAEDRHEIAAAEASAARLQVALWRIAEQASAVAPNAITGSFIRSLNQTIDLEAERDAARHNRLPGTVWVVLITVTAGASFFTGLLLRGRYRATLAALPVILAIVLGLIAELDTPRAGLLTISQHSMERLEASLRPNAVR